MAMSDYSLSDIAAVTDGAGGGNRGSGNGWGDGGWWILLLFILLGGWNGNRGVGGGNSGAGSVGGDALYPWLNQAQTQWQGISNIQQDLCNGFANVTAAVTNGFANAETAATARQMANMQQAFSLSQQFADCCCENRLGLANLGADIAREACADRAAVSDGVRDILANQNASVQRILDQMCQDKIDAKNEEIANLRQQLQMQNLAASQIQQTAQIQAGQVAEVDALYNRLRDCPVPTMPVYGMQPIFTCPTQYNNCGCNQGCGCN